MGTAQVDDWNLHHGLSSMSYESAEGRPELRTFRNSNAYQIPQDDIRAVSVALPLCPAPDLKARKPFSLMRLTI